MELDYIGKCDPKNDLWEKADTKERPLCTKYLKEPCVRVTFEQAWFSYGI